MILMINILADVMRKKFLQKILWLLVNKSMKLPMTTSFDLGITLFLHAWDAPRTGNEMDKFYILVALSSKKM